MDQNQHKRSRPQDQENPNGNDKRKKPHTNQQQTMGPQSDEQEDYDDEDYQYSDGQNQHILSHSLQKQMIKNNALHPHRVGNYQFHFPHRQMNEPQQLFIKYMTEALQNSQNALIQSSTGTGKTLSLLYSALHWAEQEYMRKIAQQQRQKQMQQGKNKPNKKSQQPQKPQTQQQRRKRQFRQRYEEQNKKIKIIYTSRAHSQLSQIAKELKKTPYRPQMLLFGARSKLCLNEVVQMRNDGNKVQLDQWHKQCNAATKHKQMPLFAYKEAIIETKNALLQLFNSIDIDESQLNTQQKQIWYKKNQVYKYLKSQKQFKDNEPFSKQQNLFKEKIVLKMIDQSQKEDQKKPLHNKWWYKHQNYKKQHIRQFRQKMILTSQLANLYQHKGKKLGKQKSTQLKNTLQKLWNAESRCQYFHNFQLGYDIEFLDKLGRKRLNNKIITRQARSNNPPLCPYMYTKRIKNFSTLYLMPYTYLLDHRILSHSTSLIQDSIIIFDQGHNVPNAACDGYSMQFNMFTLRNAQNNILDKESKQAALYKDVDEKQLENEYQIQNIINQIKQEDQRDDFSNNDIRNNGGVKNQSMKMQPQIDNSNNIRNISRNDEPKRPKKQKSKQQTILQILQNCAQSYKTFFSKQRISDFNKTGYNYDNNKQYKSLPYTKKDDRWKQIRYFHTSQPYKMTQLIIDILFKNVEKFQDSPQELQPYLNFIIKILGQIIQSRKSDKRYYFKIQNIRAFFQRIKDILFNQEFSKKFFLHIIQKAQWNYINQVHNYQGQIKAVCLAPQFAFKVLQELKPRSIIITSGTLKPINVFRRQIGLKVKQPPLNAGYVIKQDNILVRKIGFDLKDQKLTILKNYYGDNSNNHNIGNLINLFQLITYTVQYIPNGVLVVVASFQNLFHLERFYNSIQGETIKTNLLRVKSKVFFQPRDNYEHAMDQFKYYSTSNQKGAIMFCVCRAKLSQGIDFKDKLCRSVIFLGIPYLSKTDAKVLEKQKYLKNQQSYYTDTWKFIEASKAINQALGRVVRHKDDYGSILLFDIRYEITNQDSIPVVENISEWIKQKWSFARYKQTLRKQLIQFYQRCKIQFPIIKQDIYKQPKAKQSYSFRKKFLSTFYNVIEQNRKIKIQPQIQIKSQQIINPSTPVRIPRQALIVNSLRIPNSPVYQSNYSPEKMREQQPSVFVRNIMQDPELQQIFVRLNSILQYKGFLIDDIDGDGNCLYSSIGRLQGLQKSLQNSQYIKRRIINQIQQNTQLYKKAILKQQCDSSEGKTQDQIIEDYIKMVKKPSFFGGYIQILAASQIFQKAYMVHQGFVQQVINIYCLPSFQLSYNNVHHLAFYVGKSVHNYHYASIHPLGQKIDQFNKSNQTYRKQIEKQNKINQKQLEGQTMILKRQQSLLQLNRSVSQATGTRKISLDNKIIEDTQVLNINRQPDGNSFYKCLSFFIYDDQKEYPLVKQDIMDRLKLRKPQDIKRIFQFYQKNQSKNEQFKIKRNSFIQKDRQLKKNKMHDQNQLKNYQHPQKQQNSFYPFMQIVAQHHIQRVSRRHYFATEFQIQIASELKQMGFILRKNNSSQIKLICGDRIKLRPQNLYHIQQYIFETQGRTCYYYFAYDKQELIKFNQLNYMKQIKQHNQKVLKVLAKQLNRML